MARYVYDSSEYGSWHDGGLGSAATASAAIAKAAALLRGRVDGYASVTDAEAVDQRVTTIRVSARDYTRALTPRRAAILLRAMATEAGWLRPANRPRRDPGAARVIKSYSIHPDSAAKIAAEAQRSGESQGQVIDRLVQGMAHN